VFVLKYHVNAGFLVYKQVKRFNSPRFNSKQQANSLKERSIQNVLFSIQASRQLNIISEIIASDPKKHS
jgi:hypothetical protein